MTSQTVRPVEAGEQYNHLRGVSINRESLFSMRWAAPLSWLRRLATTVGLRFVLNQCACNSKLSASACSEKFKATSSEFMTCLSTRGRVSKEFVECSGRSRNSTDRERDIALFIEDFWNERADSNCTGTRSEKTSSSEQSTSGGCDEIPPAAGTSGSKEVATVCSEPCSLTMAPGCASNGPVDGLRVAEVALPTGRTVV
eukprot:CAMPEP_0117484240 /NCGR_PEP_ID=MMETSP0784-20121206/14357_1 /TAXON_ID=39447 /ORGANISM="" /LENGTH=198 /DNA_ID=CAMNT_0005278809 /DNA_START=862 /DNA_END=1458 /DNA_ORIENTATION=-